MRVTQTDMEIFLKSMNSSNPYPSVGKDSLGHGLYCETVIGGNQPLLVPDARKDKNWDHNPDLKIDMVSYFGVPILWSDEEFFGTICVLDQKENHFSEKYQKLLVVFKKIIETDLHLLERNRDLVFLSNTDPLDQLPQPQQDFE